MAYETSTFQPSAFAQARIEPKAEIARVLKAGPRRRGKQSLLARLTQRSEPSMFQKCLAVHLVAAERYRTFS
jgi:hypothetical protein